MLDIFSHRSGALPCNRGVVEPCEESRKECQRPCLGPTNHHHHDHHPPAPTPSPDAFTTVGLPGILGGLRTHHPDALVETMPLVGRA